MRTEYWPWAGGEYALYTENSEAARAAEKAGLRPVGEYFSAWRPEAGPFAWQFAGPKEVVLAVARRFAGGGAKTGTRKAAGKVGQI